MVEVRKELVQIAKEYKWGKSDYLQKLSTQHANLPYLSRRRFRYRLVRQSSRPLGTSDAGATLSLQILGARRRCAEIDQIPAPPIHVADFRVLLVLYLRLGVQWTTEVSTAMSISGGGESPNPLEIHAKLLLT